MAKKVVLLGIIVLLIAVFAGCTSSSKVSKSTTTTAAKKSQEADEDGQTKWKLDKTEFPKLSKEILAKKLPETKVKKTRSGSKETHLRLYDEKVMNFALYIPDDMIAKPGFIETGNLLYVFLNPKAKNGTDERVEFFSKPKDAETTIDSVTQAAKGTAVMNGFNTTPRTDLKLPIPGLGSGLNYSAYSFESRKSGKSKFYGETMVFEHADQIYRVTIQSVHPLKGRLEDGVTDLLTGMVWYN